ncbi:MAG: TonB-dependent receptor [Cyanobacteria bacterium P01_G01_bin.67]
MRKYSLGWNLLVFLAISGVWGLVVVSPIGAETSLDGEAERRVVLKDTLKGSTVALCRKPTRPHCLTATHNRETGRLGDFTLLETSPSQPSVVNSEQNPFRGTAADLLSQGVTRVTGVEVIQTDGGLELVLKTVAGSERLVPLILPEGNDLVIDILDATLAFAIRNGITELDPAPGITSVRVNKATENSIRVRITGETQAPSAEILPGRDDLVLSVTTDRTTTADEPDDSINVIATGQGAEEEEYFVPDADISGRIDAPLRDVPQSIQVIPEQVIEDQQATGLEEVLENAAAVTFLGNNGGRSFDAAIRGFEDAPILRDGFDDLGGFGAASAAPEIANLERVEILKGPASVLFGQAEPGGIINLVTKKPLESPYYNLQFQGGSQNFISPSIDLSGPLTENGRLLYRFNALYRTQDSFRDFDSSFDRFFIAPTIAWQISDRTDLSISLEYAEDNDPADFGTVAFGEGIADIPPERVTNNPDDTQSRENLNVGYTLEHRFSENWQLRNRFRYSFNNFEFDDFLELPFNLDESTGELTRLIGNQPVEDDAFSLYTNVKGNFNTGPLEHNLLFGVDLSRSENKLTTIASPAPEFTSIINIFDAEPDFFAVPEPEEDPPSLQDTETKTDRLGVYLKDRIDILDNLILAAGVRYDIVDQDTTDNTTGEETNQNDDAVSPNVGIVYQPIEPISLFASYSQSFAPNFVTDAEGEPLEPETGEGFDIGIKGDIIANRLSGTLSYFNITRQNIATTDPDDPFFSVATGEQQSQGVDLELSGRIIPGWNIIASYAYIDGEVTEDNDPELLGSRLPGIPEHSASLWTTYELQSGNLQGLGFGAGFNFVGERKGELPNSFEVDSFFLVNAAVFYRRENWQARINFDNLFDIDFIESIAGSTSPAGARNTGIYPGEPLTVRASISVEF